MLQKNEIRPCKHTNIKKISRMKYSRNDIIYYSISYTAVTVMLLLVLYPLIYIVSASFSSASAVNAGRVLLFPVDFSVQSYNAILQYKNVYIGYRNTIFYTITGTFINIIITMLCAYPLSRKNLMGRGVITYIFAFTMIFSGGMIPNYLLVKSLGIINTIWAMLLPNALSVYNMVVTRTFLQNNIPDELLEAAKIDGCSDTQFFFSIVLPLSKTIIAVIALFYGVGHWNAFFNAFLYLSSKNLYPLQIFLRQILIQNQIDSEMILDEDMAMQMQGLHQLLKYSMIVVSTAPLLCAYPLVQKHFVKGVMIGSLKG